MSHRITAIKKKPTTKWPSTSLVKQQLIILILIMSQCAYDFCFPIVDNVITKVDGWALKDIKIVFTFGDYSNRRHFWIDAIDGAITLSTHIIHFRSDEWRRRRRRLLLLNTKLNSSFVYSLNSSRFLFLSHSRTVVNWVRNCCSAKPEFLMIWLWLHVVPLTLPLNF